MKITFLGTGAGLPSKERNTQTTFLDLNPLYNEYWMIDAGEAAQQRVLNSRIKLGKLTTIFITHLHGDHIFGLPGLLTSRSFQGGENKPLTVYGPAGIRVYIDTVMAISASRLNYPLTIVELADEPASLQVRDINIKVQPLMHGIPSLGYRLELPDKPGRLLQDKLMAIGIPPGPVYQLFKNQASVEYEGRLYDTAQFKCEPVKGKIFSFFGDTMPCDNEQLLARSADIMVHESTYLEGDIDLSHQYFHSHIDDVAQLAVNNDVGLTLLNHISNRYDEHDIIRITADIKENYPAFNFRIVSDYMTEEL